MTPSHANKNGARYHYYVSQRLVTEGPRHATRGRRVPARDLEALVEDRLRRFLTSDAEMFNAIDSEVSEMRQRGELIDRAAGLATRWPTLPASDRRAIVLALVERVVLMHDVLEVRILPGRMPGILCDERRPLDQTPPGEDRASSLTLSVPARFERVGMETRLLIEASATRRKPDHSLIRVLAQAHQYQAMVLRNGGKTMAELAAEAGVAGPTSAASSASASSRPTS